MGTDASSIAPYEDAVLPHQELLLAGVPILEGLDLSGVPGMETTFWPRFH